MSTGQPTKMYVLPVTKITQRSLTISDLVSWGLHQYFLTQWHMISFSVQCPHSAHSLPADSPSQQLQQDRKPQAGKTQSDLLMMGIKMPETC
jgi:ligand-binding sensor domain-containing protein